jgi:hypothetical protein
MITEGVIIVKRYHRSPALPHLIQVLGEAASRVSAAWAQSTVCRKTPSNSVTDSTTRPNGGASRRIRCVKV